MNVAGTRSTVPAPQAGATTSEDDLRSQLADARVHTTDLEDSYDALMGTKLLRQLQDVRTEERELLARHTAAIEAIDSTPDFTYVGGVMGGVIGGIAGLAIGRADLTAALFTGAMLTTAGWLVGHGTGWAVDKLVGTKDEVAAENRAFFARRDELAASRLGLEQQLGIDTEDGPAS